MSCTESSGAGNPKEYEPEGDLPEDVIAANCD